MTRLSHNAPDFWMDHHAAVAAICARYDIYWATVAPLGETVLATLPGRYKSYRTEHGVQIRYRADLRMPAAQYWPNGSLPTGLVLSEDYPREPVAALEAAVDTALAPGPDMGNTPPVAALEAPVDMALAPGPDMGNTPPVAALEAAVQPAMLTVPKRKRGRPVGSKNRPKRIAPVQPIALPTVRASRWASVYAAATALAHMMRLGQREHV